MSFSFQAEYRERTEEEGEFIYPYNLGCIENLKQVFTWSGRPKSDGITWDVREGCNQYTFTVSKGDITGGQKGEGEGHTGCQGEGHTGGHI